MSGADFFFPSLTFPGDPIAPNAGDVLIPAPTNCPTAIPGLRIRFPAASFEVASAMNKIQSDCDILDKMQQGLGAVMTALKPIFDLLDLIQKVIDCITAIPDAIANANPDPVIQCIPGLAEKLAEILAYLFPPISVPPMIADILCVLKTITECLLNMVQSLILVEEKLERIAFLIATKGYAFLASAQDLSNICRESLVENLAQSTKPIQPLIDLANSIGQLVPNFPLIPSFQDLTGLPIAEIKAVVTDFQTILGTIPDTCIIGATT